MWDYPRPPKVDPVTSHVRVVHAGVTVADTRRAIRILETSQPPAYYLPRADVRTDLLVRTPSRSFCEWKGEATYWALRVPGVPEVPDAAWSYEHPTARYAAIAGYLAFYAQRVDACFVDDEQVQPNPGGFYGGWITSKVVGPFKGGPGTSSW